MGWTLQGKNFKEVHFEPNSGSQTQIPGSPGLTHTAMQLGEQGNYQ